MSGQPLPTFQQLLGPREAKGRSPLTIALATVLLVVSLIAAESALGFVFDPRYRDFPFASLTMAAIPFASLMLLNRPQQGVRPIAESLLAAILAGSAVYVGINEGPDNWQSVWTCAIYLLMALTLWRARAAQIPE